MTGSEVKQRRERWPRRAHRSLGTPASLRAQRAEPRGGTEQFLSFLRHPRRLGLASYLGPGSSSSSRGAWHRVTCGDTAGVRHEAHERPGPGSGRPSCPGLFPCRNDLIGPFVLVLPPFRRFLCHHLLNNSVSGCRGNIPFSLVS